MKTPDNITDYANGIVLKADALEAEVEKMDGEFREVQKELAELRQRFRDTEDALMRANRKLMKPVACDCPKCGEMFSVTQQGEKVISAVA